MGFLSQKYRFYERKREHPKIQCTLATLRLAPFPCRKKIYIQRILTKVIKIGLRDDDNQKSLNTNLDYQW